MSQINYPNNVKGIRQFVPKEKLSFLNAQGIMYSIEK